MATAQGDVLETEHRTTVMVAAKEALTMRRAIALLLGMLLPILGLADAGLAQSAVSTQGTIQAVDCQSRTVVLNGAGGSTTMVGTGSTTVVVNSTSVPFCTLGQYVGDSATAWLVPSGNEFLMTRIDVVGPATSAAAPTPAPAVGSPSTLGIVLGALAVGAIGYIIGHSAANQPTYQPAYQYQPVYQPAYQYGPYQYNNQRWTPRNGNRNYQQYYQQCEGTWTSQGCLQRSARDD